MKIASMKNENPSIANPTPNTEPKVAVKFGHSSPISKLRTVPVITPSANSAAITCGQVPPLDEQHHRREGDREAHQRDVHHERERLHLPCLEEVRLMHWSE